MPPLEHGLKSVSIRMGGWLLGHSQPWMSARIEVMKVGEKVITWAGYHSIGRMSELATVTRPVSPGDLSLREVTHGAFQLLGIIIVSYTCYAVIRKGQYLDC
ncbi:hypothetical protein L0F63_005798 [Massospora cicadina]|nr:hypothetical protein L0F63_005798 [Massospora cicadina]